ncbi:MAG: hypothetical protein M1138_01700 [Candidatus Thermoplasmatota archaeon]|nr:hypothetical protein [Candidatus Thermoplasmatota archaeon]MCL5793534.1 hypothetical protein [Candidatus Thermoplasmatota archaeon]
MLWNVVVTYGLAPKYAYEMLIEGNTGILQFYGFLTSSIYVYAAGLAIIILSIYMLVSNSLGSPTSPANLMIRYLLALTVSLFSIQICRVILSASFAAFSVVWNGSGTDWYNLTGILDYGSQVQGPAGSASSIITFLFLSALFFSIIALLGTLEIRQAILIFMILVLPLFSIMFAFQKTEKYAVAMWKMFAELSILPFFVLVVLEAMSFFQGDFPLQLALLFLSSALPLILMSNSRIFYSSILGSMFEGISAENVASRVSGFSGAFSAVTKAGDATSALSSLTGFRLSHEMKGLSGPYTSPETPLDWSKVYASELAYRSGD